MFKSYEKGGNEMTLEMLSGPVIGAVIGYFTNYIAVKMLFYPRKEVRVFGHKLPFTPGAIPKGKPRLAKAIANIVSNTLLTEEDIKNKIMSSDMENMAADKLMEGLSSDLKSILMNLMPSEEKYDAFMDGISENMTEQILEAIQKADLGTIIAQEGKRVVKEKTAGTMLAMFLSDDLIDSIIQPLGGEISKYIVENGKSYIEPEVIAKVNALEDQSGVGRCEKMQISEAEIRQMVFSLYRSAVENAVGTMIRQLNISEIIEEKIAEMSVEDLEKMVLTVMKKELDMIVNLGALVGAVLGIFNMFF